MRVLHVDALKALAEQCSEAHCTQCSPLNCVGWESLSSTVDSSVLVCLGTLVNHSPTDDEASLLEYHPQGTHAWSANAPIAPAYFPYNRCTVWQCSACHKAFLRYTEYGGYYVDERIRAVDPALVVDAALP